LILQQNKKIYRFDRFALRDLVGLNTVRAEDWGDGHSAGH
jgi:hypothetical protein